MSAGWSKRRDIDPLADGQARIDFEIPLSEFVRLRLSRQDTSDVARGYVQFSRDQGFVVADIEARASVPLVCQRCLGAMRLSVDTRSRVMLIGAEGEADTVPAGVETVLALEKRISVRELVEEELLLAVPLVPLHQDPQECAAVRAPQTAPAERTIVQRPFERLGELLKRDR
jgi:uncharacterized protein